MTPDAVTMLQQKRSPTHPVDGAIAKALLESAAILNQLENTLMNQWIVRLGNRNESSVLTLIETGTSVLMK
ncbi:MAG: hypothetical protein ACYSN9_04775 [Planctomycetota bacterium]|jgi:hypothetical protein